MANAHLDPEELRAHSSHHSGGPGRDGKRRGRPARGAGRSRGEAAKAPGRETARMGVVDRRAARRADRLFRPASLAGLRPPFVHFPPGAASTRSARPLAFYAVRRLAPHQTVDHGGDRRLHCNYRAHKSPAERSSPLTHSGGPGRDGKRRGRPAKPCSGGGRGPARVAGPRGARGPGQGRIAPTARPLTAKPGLFAASPLPCPAPARSRNSRPLRFPVPPRPEVEIRGLSASPSRPGPVTRNSGSSSVSARLARRAPACRRG
jgi:hypothetical protein